MARIRSDKVYTVRLNERQRRLLAEALRPLEETGADLQLSHLYWLFDCLYEEQMDSPGKVVDLITGAAYLEAQIQNAVRGESR